LASRTDNGNDRSLDVRVLEYLSSGSWMLDPRRDRYSFSEGLMTFLGYEADNLEADADWEEDNIHPEDYGKLQQAYLEHIDGGSRFFESEIRLRRRDGSYVWVLSRGVATDRDESGRVTRVVGMIFDISERKQAEENELRYKLILDTIPDVTFLKDRDGHILYVNKQYEVWTNKSASQLIGRQASQIFDYDDEYLQMERDLERQVWEKSVPITVEQDTPGRIVTEPRRVVVTRFPVLDENHEMLAIGYSATDVTERHNAEQALRASELRYRRLFDSAPVALFESDWSAGKALVDELESEGVTDLRQHLIDNPQLIRKRSDVHNILNTNLEARKIFGYDDHMGRDYMSESELTEDQRLALIEVLDGFSRGRTRIRYRGTTRRESGGEFPIVRDCELIATEDNDWSQVLVYVQDISIEVEAAAALEAYQLELQSLAGQISLAEESERRRIASELHDGTVQRLVLARMGMAKLKACVESEKLIGLIDDINELLGSSLRETRSLIFEISPPVLYELGLRAAIEWLADQYRQKSGAEVRISNEIDALNLSEELKIVMFQSVRELFNNIFKHARADQVVLSWHRNPDSVQLTVADNGCGFDIGTVGTRRSAEGGYGLFAITERLKLLGASIEIGSSPGGTSVRLTAPLCANP
jgi:PAS domain S-box-containing protein